MAVVKWSGALAQGTFRVVDNGAGQTPRVVVEMRQGPDAMGGFGWSRFDPIPRDVFEAMLLAAGVIV